jgi:hypothetical protein
MSGPNRCASTMLGAIDVEGPNHRKRLLSRAVVVSGIKTGGSQNSRANDAPRGIRCCGSECTSGALIFVLTDTGVQTVRGRGRAGNAGCLGPACSSVQK